MGRRNDSDDEGVSLFPFMSILACLIGILTLMISVVSAVKEMDRDKLTQEEYDRAVAHRDMRLEIEKLRQQAQQLDKRIENENQTVAEMQKLEEASVALKKKLEDMEQAVDPNQSDAELQKIVELLKQETKAFNDSRPPLQTRLEELQQQIKERKEAPAPEQSIVVRPGGIGSRKTASKLFFVECNSTGIVLMDQEAPPIAVPKAAIVSSEQYAKFLSRVKDTRDSMVLFLVRKAGNENYLWAAGYAESKFRVRTGKLPMPNDGKIDLSLFN